MERLWKVLNAIPELPPIPYQSPYPIYPNGSFREDYRCGEDYWKDYNYLAPNGKTALCDPEVRPCCSADGWCGITPLHCICKECEDFRLANGSFYVPPATTPRPPAPVALWQASASHQGLRSKMQTLRRAWDTLSNKMNEKPNRRKRQINVNVDFSKTIGAVVNGLSNLIHGTTMQRIKKDQARMIINIQTNSADISSIKKALAAVQLSVNNNIDRINFIDATIQMGDVINNLWRHIVDATDAIPWLAQGILTTKALSIPEASSGLGSLQQKVAAEGLVLATENTLELYGLDCSYYQERSNTKVYHVMVHIPAYWRKHAMTLFEVLAFPFQTDSSYAYPDPPTPRYLGLTEGLPRDREAVTLKENDLERCFRTSALSPTYVCSTPTIKNLQTCLPMLFDDPGSSPEPCNMKNEPPAPDYQWTRTNQLALFLPNRSPIYNTCRDKSNSELMGIHLISLTPGCYVHTPEWTFAAHKPVDRHDLLKNGRLVVNVTRTRNLTSITSKNDLRRFKDLAQPTLATTTLATPISRILMTPPEGQKLLLIGVASIIIAVIGAAAAIGLYIYFGIRVRAGLRDAQIPEDTPSLYSHLPPGDDAITPVFIPPPEAIYHEIRPTKTALPS